MKYYFAPVQGHTDAAYRHFHADVYGNKDKVSYTTPFIRLEKGELRKKDLKDILSPLNEGLDIMPQVIFKNHEELEMLVGKLYEEGLRRIDINMGCPFPLQTARGRGGATVGNPLCHAAVSEIVKRFPDVSFSVKIRLGLNEAEWSVLIETLNTLQLDHISVHPRLVKDQYMGPLSMEEFDKIYEMSKNPIVYNGDIRTPEDARRIIEGYPGLHGIMIGRGLLGRPSLLNEIISDREFSPADRIRLMMDFHRRLITHYKDNLIGGEHQVLSKIQPFWEYAEDEIGRKAWKMLKKATSMAKYQTALTYI